MVLVSSDDNISKQRICDFCDKVAIVDPNDIIFGCQQHLLKAKRETVAYK